MNVQGAGIVIQDPEGKILVTHRKPNVSEGSKWGVPGGVNKPGKTLIETAIDKTLQEVNLKYSENDLEFLGEFQYEAEGDNIYFKIWIAKISETSPKIDYNPDGHDGYIWEDPKKLIVRDDLMVGMYPILTKYLSFLSTPQS